jgi:hypothetical protein
MGPLRSTALSVLAVAASSGCASWSPQAQAVTEAPDGMWIAGTEGFAAFSDGRTVTRRDYPMSGAPDWAHGLPYGYPMARVVMIAGQAWLFTKYAAILRWSGDRWERAPASWPGIADTHQLDYALRSPAGPLVLQFHAETLAWSMDGSTGTRWTAESTAPQYYTWLGFFGDALFGIGWQGLTRTLEHRTGKDHWEVAGLLGSEKDLGEILGAVRIPGGPLAAVVQKGLVIVEEGRAGRLIPIASLVAGEHPTARASLAAAGPALNAAPAPNAAPPPPAPVSPPSPPDERRPVLKVAVDPPLPPPEKAVWVDAVLQPSGHGPMLVVTGALMAVVEIGERALTVTQCPQGTPSIFGAAMTPAGLRLVTRDAVVLALDPEAPCRAVTPPAIR